MILTSERYQRKAGAEKGIESVHTNSPNEDRFERRRSSNDDPYFVFKAANGEIIGRSEMYSSTSGVTKGIRSVQTNGPAARRVDLPR